MFMFGIFNSIFGKPESHTFKVKVILPCEIKDDKLVFDRKNETSYLVEAVDEVDAVQTLIESVFSPYPHVCIDTIEEVESDEEPDAISEAAA